MGVPFLLGKFTRSRGVVDEYGQLGVPFCLGGLEIQLGYVVLVSHFGLVVSLTVEVLVVGGCSQSGVPLHIRGYWVQVGYWYRCPTFAR